MDVIEYPGTLSIVDIAPLSRFIDPAFSGDLTGLDLAEIRARRDRCNQAEVGLSYARRLVHGRLDLLRAEGRRRRSGGGGEPLTSLVDQLPQILADHVHAPGNGRLPLIMAPGEDDLDATRDVDAIAPLAIMGALHEISDEDLAATDAGLVDLERRISGHRRALHEVFDKFQEEVIRRYKSGEADVNDLLR